MNKLLRLFVFCMLPCLVMLSSCRDEDIALPGMDGASSQTRAEVTTGGLVQQSDRTWWANRRVALVGPGRLINSINTGLLGVVSLENNLDHVVDLDLNNASTIGSGLANLKLGEPIIAVKDMYRTYKAGQKAGFIYKLVPKDAELLTVDVLQGFWIKFYNNGKSVESDLTIGNDNKVAGVGLVNIPSGDDDEERAVYAVPKGDFDEIQIGTTGLGLDLLNSIQLCYAFVGENPEIMVYNGNPFFEKEVSVDKKNTNFGWSDGIIGIGEYDHTNRWVNENPDDCVTWADVLVGTPHYATINFQQLIPAGYEIGFKYKMVDIASINLLFGSTSVRTFGQQITSRDNYQETSATTTSLLGVSLIGGSTNTVSLKTKKETYQAMFYLYNGQVSLGGGELYYAYIREPMQMDPTNYFTLGDATISANSYQLYTPKEGKVVYTVTGPGGKSYQVNEKNRIVGMNLNGDYTVEAVYTAVDGQVTVHTATITREASVTEGCNILLTEEKHEAQVANSVKGNTSGCLLCLEGYPKGQNMANLTDGSLSTYVTYVGGVNLAQNIPVTSIYLNNTTEIKTVLQQGKKVRVGFIVQAETGLLDVDALRFFRIRLFRNNQEVDDGVTEENATVDASLVGESGNSMMRLSIVTDQQFDQIELWTSGVVSLNLNRLRLYSAFYEQENSACESVGIGEACMEMMTPINSNASINYAKTSIDAPLLEVLGGIKGLEYIIDDDMETAALEGDVAKVLQKTTIAIKFNPIQGGQQLGFVLDGTGSILNLELVKANWYLSVYNSGTLVASTENNIDLLDLDLLSHGDKSFLEITPKTTVDEIRIEFRSLIDALTSVKLCGLYIRPDENGNGIPDCSEDGDEPVSLGFRYTGESSNICEDGSGYGTVKVYIENIDPSAENAKQPGDFITVSYSSFSEDFKIEHTAEVEIKSSTGGEMYFEIRLPVDEHLFVEGTSSATVRVYPLQTEWTGKVDNQWNSWGNWTEGAPWTCTNVIIPSSAPNYPKLEKNAENHCAGIHFEPGGEVVNTHYLDYDLAWVDMELAGGRYYMLSAPLKDMYTGDIFISKDSQWGEANYFFEMDEESYIEYRITPRIYQRLWSSIAIGVTLNNGDTNVTPGETFWTAPFNAVNTRFEMGQGFSVKAEGPSSNRFYFPKMHKIYNYFYSTGNSTGKSDRVNRTGNGYRFIYEGAESKEGTWQVTLKNTEGHNNGKTSTFLLGNPFMAHVNIQKFLKRNESVLTGEVKVYDGNTLNSEIRVDDELVSYSNSNYTHIAPMQSVFVTATNADAASVTVTFTADMLEQMPDDKMRSRSVPAEVQQKGIRITATDGVLESRCLLLKHPGTTDAYRAGEDTEVLIDPATAPGVVVFTVADDKALDIQQFQTAKRIPLGFVVKEEVTGTTLKFSFAEKEWNEWVLKDTETGKSYDLKSGSVFVGNLKSNVGRLYLEKIN